MKNNKCIAEGEIEILSEEDIRERNEALAKLERMRIVKCYELNICLEKQDKEELGKKQKILKRLLMNSDRYSRYNEKLSLEENIIERNRQLDFKLSDKKRQKIFNSKECLETAYILLNKLWETNEVPIREYYGDFEEYFPIEAEYNTYSNFDKVKYLSIIEKEKLDKYNTLMILIEELGYTKDKATDLSKLYIKMATEEEKEKNIKDTIKESFDSCGCILLFLKYNTHRHYIKRRRDIER